MPIQLDHCDLNVTSACNAHCVGCSHLAPVIKPSMMPLDVILRDLEAIKPVAHFKTICCVGGEPTLHPRLADIISLIQGTEVSDEVMVITNGRRLRNLDTSFWEALQGGSLRISIYPNLDKDIPKFAQDKCAEREIRYEEIEFVEFYRQFKAKPDDGRETFEACPWKSDCRTIHYGKFYLCPQSVFFWNLFPTLKEGADGLDLAGITEESLRSFLDRKEPLTTCQHCSGGHSNAFPWRESKDKQDWIKQATV